MFSGKFLVCVNTIFVSHVWGCFNVYGRKLNIPVINLFINERSVTELRLSNFATVWRVLLTVHNKLNLLPFMWSIIKNARIVFMSVLSGLAFLSWKKFHNCRRTSLYLYFVKFLHDANVIFLAVLENSV